MKKFRVAFEGSYLDGLWTKIETIEAENQEQVEKIADEYCNTIYKDIEFIFYEIYYTN